MKPGFRSAKAWARSRRRPLRRPLKVFEGNSDTMSTVDDARVRHEHGELSVGNRLRANQFRLVLFPLGRQVGEVMARHHIARIVAQLNDNSYLVAVYGGGHKTKSGRSRPVPTRCHQSPCWRCRNRRLLRICFPGASTVDCLHSAACHAPLRVCRCSLPPICTPSVKRFAMLERTILDEFRIQPAVGTVVDVFEKQTV